jgi:plasmid stabilization system protein ParE
VAVRWTSQADGDLARLHGFLDPVNPQAAARLVERVLTAVGQLGEQPRLGRRLLEYAPRDVRRLIAGDYEIRYELSEDDLVVLRIWHVREER